MNRTELENILPHRNTMLLLDSAEVTAEGEAHGTRLIRGDEFFLDGHFPGNPVVPGVILCEILAQSACVLLAHQAAGKDLNTLLTGLDKVRFRQPVRPGDTVETHCRITAKKGPFYQAEGSVSVQGKLCMNAQFSFAAMPKEGT